MTELDVFAKFKHNGHEWTIEWIGQTHQPHLKVLIGSVMARGKKQLMLFIHGARGFAPTSWSGQYSSKEIRGRRDQLQEEQQEIPMRIKKFVEFVNESKEQHKAEADKYRLKAAEHEEGTFDHHDAMAKHHFHMSKYRIRSDEHMEKANAHRALADKLA